MRDRFHWARLLAFVRGLVNQDLLLRNEYLIAENRILRGHLSMRLRLADPERVTLAEIAKRLGRQTHVCSSDPWGNPQNSPRCFEPIVRRSTLCSQLRADSA